MSLKIIKEEVSTPMIVADHFKLPFRAPNVYLPPVNIWEDDSEFSIEVATPGHEEKDFRIALESNVLTISTEKLDEIKEKKENFKRIEFYCTSFSRSFILPDSVLPDKIEAKYANGILQLSFPKKGISGG